MAAPASDAAIRRATSPDNSSISLESDDVDAAKSDDSAGGMGTTAQTENQDWLPSSDWTAVTPVAPVASDPSTTISTTTGALLALRDPRTSVVIPYTIQGVFRSAKTKTFGTARVPVHPTQHMLVFARSQIQPLISVGFVPATIKGKPVRKIKRTKLPGSRISDNALNLRSDGQLAFRGKLLPFSDPWREGDVIGFGYDETRRRMFFTRNGEHMGIAQEGKNIVGYVANVAIQGQSTWPILGSLSRKPYFI